MCKDCSIGTDGLIYHNKCLQMKKKIDENIPSKKNGEEAGTAVENEKDFDNQETSTSSIGADVPVPMTLEQFQMLEAAKRNKRRKSDEGIPTFTETIDPKPKEDEEHSTNEEELEMVSLDSRPASFLNESDQSVNEVWLGQEKTIPLLGTPVPIPTSPQKNLLLEFSFPQLQEKVSELQAHTELQNPQQQLLLTPQISLEPQISLQNSHNESPLVQQQNHSETHTFESSQQLVQQSPKDAQNTTQTQYLPNNFSENQPQLILAQAVEPETSYNSFQSKQVETPEIIKPEFSDETTEEEEENVVPPVGGTKRKLEEVCFLFFSFFPFVFLFS